MKALTAVLREVEQEPVVLENRVLVLPHGGRVMGLSVDGDMNTHWVNPALGSVASAAELLSDPGWANLGGDRTWISPELETHIADPARFADTYEVPKAVDPAEYRITEQDDRSISLSTDMQLEFKQSGVTVDLKLSKSVSLLDEPPLELPEGVDWAGYAMHTRLESDALPANVFPAAWHILQVPGGGRIILPVHPGAQPRAFIGDPVYRDEGDAITCDVDTAQSFKFSLHARDCTGLLIYLQLDADQPYMLIRKLSVLDEDLYTDVPCDDLSDTGYVEQVYVDDGGFGGFGELEYHTTALGKHAAKAVSDANMVWALTGDAASLSMVLDDFREASGDRPPAIDRQKG